MSSAIASLIVANARATNAMWQARLEGEKALQVFGIALGYLSWPRGSYDAEIMAWHSFVSTYYLSQAHASACFWAGRAADLEAAAVFPKVCA